MRFSRRKKKNNNSWLGESNYLRNILGHVWNQSKSKVTVTPETAKGLATYYACIRVISEDVAKLPFEVYTMVEGTKRPTNEDVEYVLNFKWNPHTTAITGRQTLQSHALGWGVGLAYIQLNRFGDLDSLWPIHPSRLSYQKEQNGDLYWVVSNDDGSKSKIYDRNMLRITGLGDDAVWGDTPAKIGADSIGSAIAEQTHSATFFANGANLQGVLEMPGKLAPDVAERLKESWNNEYQGSPNGHKTAILEDGIKYNTVTVKPVDAQLLENKLFSVTEICRWFRVAPHKVQHLEKSTNNNIAAQDVAHATDTLHPWAVRWEQEIVMKLLQPKERVKLSFRELLRGDNKTRSEYYLNMFFTSSMSPDDIRTQEGMDPRKDGMGANYYIPINTASNSERERIWPEVSETNSSMNSKMMSKILMPFATKESKAMSKASSQNKDMSEFMSRHLVQIESALTGIVEPTRLSEMVSEYKKIRQKNTHITDCDRILSELETNFGVNND